MHEHKNIHTCDTCINWSPQGDDAGQCREPRLNDITRRYSNSLQPDRQYYPRINFRTKSGFGCVFHINKIENE